MTIYLFLRHSYSPRLHHDYGGSYFSSLGFNYEVWIFPFLGVQKIKPTINSNSQIPPSVKVVIHHSKSEALSALNKLKANSIIFDPASVLVDPDMPFNETINTCFKVIFALQSLPRLPSSLTHLFSRLYSRPIYTLRMLLRKVNFFSVFYNTLKPSKVTYDLGVSAGKFSRLKIKPHINKQTGSILKTHSSDCELVLQSEDQLISDLPLRYAIFLDEFVPYHPDHQILGIDYYVSPDPYYDELNKYFSWFESRYRLEIIIAAHPKSNYSSLTNPFNDRVVIHRKTPLLVSHAILCFTHCSTSISFAILNFKPVISLFSSSYSPIFNRRIAHMSKIIGTPLLDVSSFSDYGPEYIPKPSLSLYNQYTNDYLYEGSPPSQPFLESLLHSLPKL